MKRASRYRDRVRLERETATGALDAYGNPVAPTWAPLAPLADFWGDLRVMPGKDRLEAGRMEGSAVATLRLRYSAEARAITAADRVVARGFAWAITSDPVDPDGTRRAIEMTLERGVAVT